MSNVRKISRGLLLIEALLLAFPSFWGLFICIGGIHPFIFDLNNNEQFANFFVYLIIFLTLISGWRILFWVASEGIIHGKRISRGWWLCAFLGVVISILSLIMPKFTKLFGKYSMSHMFIMGNMFIPTFLHLIFETQRQKQLARLNKPLLTES